MIIWITVIGLAVLLVYLLRLQRAYERESAAVAREQIESLRVEMQELTKRIENLEIIASDPDALFVPRSTEPSGLPEANPSDSEASPGRRSRSPLGN